MASDAIEPKIFQPPPAGTARRVSVALPLPARTLGRLAVLREPVSHLWAAAKRSPEPRGCREPRAAPVAVRTFLAMGRTSGAIAGRTPGDQQALAATPQEGARS